MIKIFSKIKNSTKVGYYFLGIPIVKRRKNDKYKKIYFCGIRVAKKEIFNIQKNEIPVLQDANILTLSPVLEKEIIRLEGMKLILKRENITFGDKI